MKTKTCTYTIPYTSHEFSMLSWYFAKESGTTELEFVKEEPPDHQIIFGLKAQSPEVIVPQKGKRVQFTAKVIDVGDPIGTFENAELLKHLIFTIPATTRPQSIIQEAAKAYGDEFHGMGMTVYYTRKNYENVFWARFGNLPHRDMNTVKLVGGLEKTLLEDVRKFIKDKKVYEKFGRPFKRVYLLHGPPGTGKSSVVTAISSSMKMDLCIFNVDSLRDDTFIELLSDVPSNSIILFEDVDALFKARESKNTTGMSFSTLLNCLDGILHPRNAIVFLTTNHLEKLDQAIIRSGRVDVLLEVPLAGSDQVSEMWKLAYPNVNVPSDLLLACNSHKNGVSPAKTSEVLFNHRDSTPDVAKNALISAWGLSDFRITKPKKS